MYQLKDARTGISTATISICITNNQAVLLTITTMDILILRPIPKRATVSALPTVPIRSRLLTVQVPAPAKLILVKALARTVKASGLTEITGSMQVFLIMKYNIAISCPIYALMVLSMLFRSPVEDIKKFIGTLVFLLVLVVGTS